MRLKQNKDLINLGKEIAKYNTLKCYTPKSYNKTMRIKAITKRKAGDWIVGTFKTDSGLCYKYEYNGNIVRTSCKIRGVRQALKERLTKPNK